MAGLEWQAQYVFGLGPTELIIILAIVLLIFGPRKLPQIGEALGKSLKAFKRSSEGTEEEAKAKGEPEEVAAKAESSKAEPTPKEQEK